MHAWLRSSLKCFRHCLSETIFMIPRNSCLSSILLDPHSLLNVVLLFACSFICFHLSFCHLFVRPLVSSATDSVFGVHPPVFYLNQNISCVCLQLTVWSEFALYVELHKVEILTCYKCSTTISVNFSSSYLWHLIST